MLSERICMGSRDRQHGEVSVSPSALATIPCQARPMRMLQNSAMVSDRTMDAETVRSRGCLLSDVGVADSSVRRGSSADTRRSARQSSRMVEVEMVRDDAALSCTGGWRRQSPAGLAHCGEPTGNVRRLPNSSDNRTHLDNANAPVACSVNRSSADPSAPILCLPYLLPFCLLSVLILPRLRRHRLA